MQSTSLPREVSLDISFWKEVSGQTEIVFHGSLGNTSLDKIKQLREGGGLGIFSKDIILETLSETTDGEIDLGKDFF